jgi:hypothetical protein
MTDLPSGSQQHPLDNPRSPSSQQWPTAMSPPMVAPPQRSGDGRWWWNGYQWVPAAAPPMAAPPQMSGDGRWWWNGYQWVSAAPGRAVRWPGAGMIAGWSSLGLGVCVLMFAPISLIGIFDMRASGARGSTSDVLSVLALASPAVLLGIMALAWPRGNRNRRIMACFGIGAAMSGAAMMLFFLVA